LEDQFHCGEAVPRDLPTLREDSLKRQFLAASACKDGHAARRPGSASLRTGSDSAQRRADRLASSGNVLTCIVLFFNTYFCNYSGLIFCVCTDYGVILPVRMLYIANSFIIY
jgi:hypothetical protein